MKKFLNIGMATTVLAISLSPVSNVFADSTSGSLKDMVSQIQTDTQKQISTQVDSYARTTSFAGASIDEIGQYVLFDSETQKYVLSDLAYSVFSDQTLKEVEDTLATQNDYRQQLQEMNSSNDSVLVSTASNGVLTVDDVSSENQELRYQNGINKVSVYWYGFRVYMSRTTLHALGAGTSIGGIWVPEPVVSKILATVGVVAALAPGGIKFNFSPAVTIIPWGLEWQ